MTLSRLSIGFSVLSVLGMAGFACSSQAPGTGANGAKNSEAATVEVLDSQVSYVGLQGTDYKSLMDPAEAAPPPDVVDGSPSDDSSPEAGAGGGEASFSLTAGGKKSSRYDFNGDGISDLVSKNIETGALTVHFVKKVQDPVFKGYFEKSREVARKARGFASGNAFCDALYALKTDSLWRGVYHTSPTGIKFAGPNTDLEAACKANPVSLGVFESKVIAGATVGRYAKLVGSADMDGNQVPDLIYRHWQSDAVFVILLARNAAGDLSQIRRVALPTIADRKWMIVGVGSGPDVNFNYIYLHHTGDPALKHAAQPAIAGTLRVWKVPRSYFAAGTEGQGLVGYSVSRIANFGWWPVGVEDFTGDGIDDVVWSRYFQNDQPVTSKCSHIQPVCAKQGLVLTLHEMAFNPDGTFLYNGTSAVKSARMVDLTYAPGWDHTGAVTDEQTYHAKLNSTRSFLQGSGAFNGHRPRYGGTTASLLMEAQYPNWLVDMYGFDRNNQGGAQKVWGDFNGDGRPDVAYLSVTPQTGRLNASVYASAGQAVTHIQDGNYVARVSSSEFYSNMKSAAVTINLPAYNALVASGMNFKSNYETKLIRNEQIMGEVSILNQGELGKNGSFRPGKPIAGLKVLVGGLAPGWWPNANATLGVDVPSTVWDMW